MKKGLVMLAGVLMAPAMALGVAAVVPSGEAYAQVTDGLKIVEGSTVSKTTANDLIQSIINLLLTAIAIVSVIMLIIGGFKYTTSNGDANQVTAAKNTIMYSIIGLVVAIFAYAIVDFVVKKI